MPQIEPSGLTSRQVQNFIDDGFVEVTNAFGTDLAKQCREELWADIGLSPNEPEHWIQPVVRVGAKASPPFIRAANTPRLHRAYDQLAGDGRWLAPNTERFACHHCATVTAIWRRGRDAQAALC